MTVDQTWFFVLSIIVSYLICAIPFALIIGKVFYKIDIREHGSHNLGGTNAGRVLGRKPGFVVMVLDVLKNTLALIIARFILAPLFGQIDDITFVSNVIFIAGTFGVIGHCYPIFANFRGGKAVSVAAGFIIATNIYLIIGLAIVFFTTLKLSKIVSLSSMLSLLVLTSLSFIPFFQQGMNFSLQYSWIYSICLIFITILLIYRHRENIVRLLHHTERKITWLK